MSGLTRPAVLASLLSLAALLLHPSLGTEAWLPGRRVLLAALLLLCAVALLGRAWAARGADRAAAWLVGGGLALALLGIAADGLRGRDGVLRLASGAARSDFDELDPGGRSLGLRPLGFAVGLERVTAGGAALLLGGASTPVELQQGHALTFGGFRLADPRTTFTGGVVSLRVAVSDGKQTQLTELGPDRPARAGDLVLSLERYFPDFALDERQQPFTRSLEPRNPAALLIAQKAGQSYRAFVIQSMPGVHRVERLGLTFSLLGVEPEQSTAIQVHREPLAPAVLLGALLLLGGAGTALVRAVRSPARAAPVDRLLLAATALLAGLALVDGGGPLAWSFGVPTVGGGRVPLEGVGVLLGLALIGALAGTLLLTAEKLGGEAGVRPLARAALWTAVGVGAAAVALAAVRIADLPRGLGLAGARPVVGVVFALALPAAALRVRGRAAERLFSLGLPALAVLALLVAVAAGIHSTVAHGTYATLLVAASASTALLALAAVEATGLAGLRFLALLLAFLTLLVRPI